MNINQAELLEAARPLMDYLNNFHPHCVVVVSVNDAEFFEGLARVIDDKHDASGDG